MPKLRLRMVFPALGLLLGAVLWAAPCAFAVDDSITISTRADNNVTCNAGTCVSKGINANLSITTLQTNLLSGNLTVGDGSPIMIESSIDSTSSNSLALDGPVVIGSDLSVVSTAGTITFDSTVDGAHTLTVSTDGGSVNFKGAIGSTTPLTGIEIPIGPSSTELNASVTTTGSQDYGPVMLGSDVTFSAGQTVTFNDSVSGAHQLTIAAGTVNVPASATVNTPVIVNSGGTLNCDDGTLNGGVTDDGGTATGAPAAPTNAITSVSSRAATISFSPGAPNCFPVTYTATAGALSFGPATGTPITATGLTGGQTYTFNVVATNPIGSSSTTSPSVIPPPYPPTITITSPVKNGAYVRGQVVKASYRCNDGPQQGAGIASCSGSTASGTALNTQTSGLHRFTVTAISSGGATTTLSVTYMVLAAPASTATRLDKFTIKQLAGHPTGAIDVSLAGLIGAGTIKLTSKPAGLRAFTVHKTANVNATLKFTLEPSGQMKSWIARHHGERLNVKVSIGYTPRGGEARTVTQTVRL